MPKITKNKQQLEGQENLSFLMFKAKLKNKEEELVIIVQKRTSKRKIKWETAKKKMLV